VALYSDALGTDPLADAVNAVLFCNRAASHMALGKHDNAVSAGTNAPCMSNTVTSSSRAILFFKKNKIKKQH
jgi:hypothetical protein